MTVPGLPRPAVPDTLAPYVEALGAELAMEVFLTFGGSEVHLSPGGTGGGALVVLVGPDRFARLTAHPAMPAFKVRIPLASAWIARMLHWQGWSTAAIARRLRRSDSTVRGYLKGAGGGASQSGDAGNPAWRSGQGTVLRPGE